MTKIQPEMHRKSSSNPALSVYHKMAALAIFLLPPSVQESVQASSVQPKRTFEGINGFTMSKFIDLDGKFSQQAVYNLLTVLTVLYSNMFKYRSLTGF